MNYKDFPGSNTKLLGNNDDVGDLPVAFYPKGSVEDMSVDACLSCWEPTEEERKAIADGGDVWVWVMAPRHAQPPVAITGINPYKESGE